MAKNIFVKIVYSAFLVKKTNHRNVCLKVNGKQSIKMPKKGSTVKFLSYWKQLQVPFVIYADSEAITEKTNKLSGSATTTYQKHKACSYGYKVICCYDDKYSKPIKIYRGEDSIDKFIEDMLE